MLVGILAVPNLNASLDNAGLQDVVGFCIENITLNDGALVERSALNLIMSSYRFIIRLIWFIHKSINYNIIHDKYAYLNWNE